MARSVFLKTNLMLRHPTQRTYYATTRAITLRQSFELYLPEHVCFFSLTTMQGSSSSNSNNSLTAQVYDGKQLRMFIYRHNSAIFLLVYRNKSCVLPFFLRPKSLYFSILWREIEHFFRCNTLSYSKNNILFIVLDSHFPSTSN